MLKGREDLALSTTLRQEVNRELHYFNNIIYGTSRLLKRPASQFVTEHIDTKVAQIGTLDTLDKGMGFESVNINDPKHECVKLTEESKRVLLELRLEIVEFIISLAGQFTFDFDIKSLFYFFIFFCILKSKKP